MEADTKDPRAAPPLAQLLVRDTDPVRRARPASAVWALAGSRFVVPDDPRLAARALLAYNRLRPPRVRAGRAALATMLRTPARRVLTTHVQLPTGPSLLDHLAQVLGESRLVFAGSDTGGSGWRTPVLQLFTPDGVPRGYAKIGWDPVTIAMVDTEADALTRAAAAQWRSVRVPRLAWSGRYSDLALLVTEPMPARIRRLRRGEQPAVDALHEVAELHGPRQVNAVRSSRFWAEAMETAANAPHDVGLVPMLDAIDITSGDVEIPFGSWHGDWVEWNLGATADGIVAWDWAYCAAGVPFGFDVLQFFHLRHRNLHGRPGDEALTRAGVEAAPYLERLGLDADQARATTALHRLEVALRTERARARRDASSGRVR